MQEVSRKIAVSLGVKLKPAPSHLSVVTQGNPNGLTALQRDVHYARIRDLGNMYWLNWLIRQETMHCDGIMECLGDEELMSLLRKMQRAKDCREEGVGFDEVPGLVKAIQPEY
ncbi:hypothetical protein RT95_20730 [Xanthomonas campestris]|nr:hypothetical protein RT95_20730 [Xanthomonas campestris]